MSKAKIERSQKLFLKAMKAKFAEEPKPPKQERDNHHPTIIVGYLL